jgi:hypothetical protein
MRSFLVDKLPDECGGLIPIYTWHVTIHEDQVVFANVAVILFKALLDHLNGLVS